MKDMNTPNKHKQGKTSRMRMQRIDDERIAMLLERFMEGETSLEEEDELSVYFRSGSVRPEWEAYQEMFAYFDGGMAEETPRTHIRLKRRQPMVAAAIAAVILLGAGLLLILQQSNHPNDNQQLVVVEEGKKDIPEQPNSVPEGESPVLQESRKAVSESHSKMLADALQEVQQLHYEEVIEREIEHRMEIQQARTDNDVCVSLAEIYLAEYYANRLAGDAAPPVLEVEPIAGDEIPEEGSIMSLIMQ